VTGIREVEAGLGTTKRIFEEKEKGQRRVHRRSIVIGIEVQSGEVFTRNNLVIKRPGIGIKPKYLNFILGKKSKINYKPDELLSWENVVA
jgi:sialic acid synthase SpsE